ncbi:MAG TPA: protein-glutamate O-methyltransferase CheR [Mucilaginibacter sp.]|jgi:chemotaxis protein methyltransferase CheR|nr:protein-glutamate O-methyltransferase CheR [Mucilaginibacter sp.]
MNTAPPNISAEEIAELAEAVSAAHGFDFSDYSKSSLKRRIIRVMTIKKLGFAGLMRQLTTDVAFFQDFLEEVTVNVTEMFRDPTFYRALATQVVPNLPAQGQIKIWSAGCASGEEAYSFAILMSQFGLKDKTFICGTDVNTAVIKAARKGSYSQRSMTVNTENYKQCGLAGSLNNYFTVSYDTASIYSDIKQNMLFSIHNLVSDEAFDEFQIISCRNVFIYFETVLQERILDMFYRSLSPDGYLCLGSKETIRSDRFKQRFKPIDPKENIYQKISI